jgi:hypothetical protein
MSDNRFIRMLALIAVLATASLWPAGVNAGYGGHSSSHASTPSGNGGTGGTNRNMTPTADRGSGKPVGGHSMGYVRCFRACMAVPNPGGMARFCSAACSR